MFGPTSTGIEEVVGKSLSYVVYQPGQLISTLGRMRSTKVSTPARLRRHDVARD